MTKWLWIGSLSIIFILLQTEFKVFSKIARAILFRERLILKQTPSTIKSIQSINELISAEFCGEVYASLEEVLQQDAEDEWNIREKELENLFNNIKIAANNLQAQGEDSPKKRWKAFKKDPNYLFLQENELYQELREMTGIDSDKDQLEQIRELTWDEFRKTKYNEIKINFIDNRASNASLIYIARGCVQAGIKLSFLRNDENIEQNKNNDSTLFLISDGVDILDPIINPWFVPGEISGFEVWEENKEAKKLSFEEIKKVKALCKDKLLSEAVSSGLKERALKNAEITLNALIKSINKKKKSVRLSYPKVEYYTEKFLNDSIFNIYEYYIYENDIISLIEAHSKDSLSWSTHDYKKTMIESTKILSKFCNQKDRCPDHFKEKFDQVLNM